MKLQLTTLIALYCLLASCAAPPEETRPQAPPAAPAASAVTLPSWNDGIAREAIVDFVTKTTRQGDADFVPPAERIIGK